MAEHSLGSGARLTINPAPYEDAVPLKDIVLKSLRSHVKDLSAVDAGDMQANGALIMDIVLEVATQPDFEKAMMRCAERASWRPPGTESEMKINASLFNHQYHGQEARTDYLEICWRVVEANVMPFLSGVSSRLKAAIQTTAPSLKSA
jgi:hypothetical protein